MATGSSGNPDGKNKSLRDTFLGFINDAMLPFVHKAGITMPQLQLLRMLEQNPHTSQELAQRLCVSPSAVTQLVDKLVARNLVSRMKQPPNLRIVWLQSTPQGLKVLSEFEELISCNRLAERLMESSSTVGPTVTIDFDDRQTASWPEKTPAASASPYPAVSPFAMPPPPPPESSSIFARADIPVDQAAARASLPESNPLPKGSPPQPASINSAPAQVQPEKTPLGRTPPLSEPPQFQQPGNGSVNKPAEKVVRTPPVSISPGGPSVESKSEPVKEEQTRDFAKTQPTVDKPLAQTVELQAQPKPAGSQPPPERKSLQMSDYYQMIRRNIKR